MLRKINEALFAAPAGATIQVVVESQGNNGVNDARFEYGSEILDRETIDGLPGCTFTVASSRERLEAGVVFDPGAPGSARYDMFEIENGVKSSLDKSVKSSSASPLIAFAIRPDAAVFGAAPAPSAMPRSAVARVAPPKGKKRKASKNGAKKAAKKAAPKRKTSPKRKGSRKSSR